MNTTAIYSKRLDACGMARAERKSRTIGLISKPNIWALAREPEFTNGQKKLLML